jgi:hypothetical protein
VAQAEVTVSVDHEEVEGLMVCTEFLSLAEVKKLREVFAAHRIWTRYLYGKKDLTGTNTIQQQWQWQ